MLNFLTMVYKKIAVLVVTALALVSCGAGRSTVSSTKSSALHDELIDYGKKYIGKPYRYASRGPNSFDCSGFTSFVFKEFGYSLSPSSAGQDQQVPSIRRKKDLVKGDLVFFEGRARNGRVGHVGIVTQVRPNGEFDFIHASTTRGVIVSKSTEQYYASRYLRGGRVIDNAQLAAKRPPKRTPPPAGNTKKRSEVDKKNNIFTPATAKKEPKAPAVPVVSPEISESEHMPVLANEKAEPVIQKTEETVVLVQTDPLKNPQLANNDSTKQEEEPENNALRMVADTLFTFRNDSLDVPEPVAQHTQETRALQPQTHTVKPGETLYSISRKYNCTVEQLQQWNPQLSGSLKAGETITVIR